MAENRLETQIRLYGEEEGIRRYNEANKKRAFTLENRIRLYGEEEGTRRYNVKLENNKIKGTLLAYIKKYGEEEGTRKYLEKNSRLSIGKDALKRNGKTEEEIIKIRETHSNRSKNTLENMIKRYGEIEGTNRFNSYVEKKTKQSLRTIDGWINLGFSNDEAIEKLKDYQNTSSLDKFIKRFGEDEGSLRYRECNIKKLTNFGTSNLEINFFIELSKLIDLDLEKGRNCRIICENSIYFCDYFHSAKNKIIEIFGTFWHMKPELFRPFDVNSVIKMSAQEIWDKDEKRISTLKEYGYESLIIWEDDINTDSNKQLAIAKQFLES